jgi:hypothetical protein
MTSTKSKNITGFANQYKLQMSSFVKVKLEPFLVIFFGDSPADSLEVFTFVV